MEARQLRKRGERQLEPHVLRGAELALKHKLRRKFSADFTTRHADDPIAKAAKEYVVAEARGEHIENPGGFLVDVAYKRAIDALRKEGNDPELDELEAASTLPDPSVGRRVHCRSRRLRGHWRDRPRCRWNRPGWPKGRGAEVTQGKRIEGARCSAAAGSAHSYIRLATASQGKTETRGRSLRTEQRRKDQGGDIRGHIAVRGRVGGGVRWRRSDLEPGAGFGNQRSEPIVQPESHPDRQ